MCQVLSPGETTNSTTREILYLVCGLAVLLVIAFIFTTGSAGRYNEVPQVNIAAPLRPLEISASKPLRFDFTAGGIMPDGFVFFTDDKRIKNQVVGLIVQDNNGHIISRSYGTAISYDKQSLLSIRVFVKSFAVKPGSKLTLTFESRGGSAMKLLANGDDERLTVPYSVLQKQPLNTAERTGVGIALGLAAAVLLWTYLERYRLLRNYRWAMACLLIAAGGILLSLPFLFPAGWGIDDWDYRLSIGHIYRAAILNFHQLPFWNPYICGGAAGLGDPEFALFSPYFLLQVLFGERLGTGLALPLAFIVTGWGMLLLAKYLKLSPRGSLLGAFVVMFASALPLKAAEGHTTIIFAFMWVPWALWCWLAAYQKTGRRDAGASFWILACGCFLALMVLAGGIYMLSYTLLAFTAACGLLRQRFSAMTVSAGALAWSVVLSAFQFVPTLLWLKQFPDKAFVNSADTFAQLYEIFMARHWQGEWVIPDQVSKWHEYGAYVGLGVVLLTLVGLAGWRRREAIRYAAMGFLVTVLMAASGPMLVSLFSLLPFFPRSNISRLVLFALIFVGILSGFGVARLGRWFGKRSYVVATLIGLIVIDIFSLSFTITSQGFAIEPITGPRTFVAFPIEHTDNTYKARYLGFDTPRAYASIKKGYGTSSFCAVLGPKSAVQLASGEEHPAFIQASPDTVVILNEWSPNQFTFTYSAAKEATVTFNGNYAFGWRTSLGQIINDQGRLGVRMPTGHNQSVAVSYYPPGLNSGIVISLLGTCLAFYVLARRRTWPVVGRNTRAV